MGTHPIFESDFDCLTDMNRISHLGLCKRNLTTAYRLAKPNTKFPPIDPIARDFPKRSVINAATEVSNLDVVLPNVSKTELDQIIKSRRIKAQSANNREDIAELEKRLQGTILLRRGLALVILFAFASAGLCISFFDRQIWAQTEEELIRLNLFSLK